MAHTINNQLAERIRDTGLAQIAEQRDPAQTIEAVLMGSLALARVYMPPVDVARYLRSIAHHLEMEDQEYTSH
ncbi:MAG TPA: hypothetical protein VFN16_06660 [Saccharospirillum sp.]|nr:hypothetical protein [Saccharospirillum sp.]